MAQHLRRPASPSPSPSYPLLQSVKRGHDHHIFVLMNRLGGSLCLHSDLVLATCLPKSPQTWEEFICFRFDKQLVPKWTRLFLSVIGQLGGKCKFQHTKRLTKGCICFSYKSYVFPIMDEAGDGGDLTFHQFRSTSRSNFLTTSDNFQ